jgi:hypothetical protein
MWERADGVRSPACREPHHPVTARGIGEVRLGSSARTLLRLAGQPQQRTRAWSWCVRGRRNLNAEDVAVLSRSGKVQLVGSTARGRSAAGIAVGAAARWARGRSAGSGVRFVRTRRGAWVYAVRGGRVSAVAFASRALARRPRSLGGAMRLMLAAKATAQPRVFVPSAAQAAAKGRLNGQPLAGTSDPRLNEALAMLCGLQVGGVSASAGAAR